jgi:ribosome-binding protein aMBF1 (putative translation factor)
MRTSKRKRLQAAGWKVGDARTFLGLSDEEAALVEMKLALADHLRRRRRARHVSQVELAGQLGSSQSRVAKMEAGDGSVSLDLLVRALLALGETPRAVARVLGRHAA